MTHPVLWEGPAEAWGSGAPVLPTLDCMSLHLLRNSEALEAMPEPQPLAHSRNVTQAGWCEQHHALLKVGSREGEKGQRTWTAQGLLDACRVPRSRRVELDPRAGFRPLEPRHKNPPRQQEALLAWRKAPISTYMATLCENLSELLEVNSIFKRPVNVSLLT